MDTAHSLLALIVAVVAMKWYAHCQVLYWYSPECRRETKPKTGKAAREHDRH